MINDPLSLKFTIQSTQHSTISCQIKYIIDYAEKSIEVAVGELLPTTLVLGNEQEFTINLAMHLLDTYEQHDLYNVALIQVDFFQHDEATTPASSPSLLSSFKSVVNVSNPVGTMNLHRTVYSPF